MIYYRWIESSWSLSDVVYVMDDLLFARGAGGRWGGG